MQLFFRKLRRGFRRFWRRTKPGLVSATRATLRGAYKGTQALAQLPSRTLLMFGSAISFVLVSIILLVIVLPGAPSSAEGVQTAFAMDGMPQSAVTPDPFALNPSQTPDPSGAGGLSEGDDATNGAKSGADTTAQPSDTPFTTLEEGDDGAIVTEIQIRLMDLGYMDSDEPTEHFGPITKGALKTFQKHNDLSADGICGLETYTLLMSGDAKVYVMQQGDEGDDVEAVQQRLYELGYLSESNVIGNFGEKTSAAVKDFQAANKIKDDGKVGGKTLEALYGEDPVGKTFSYGDESDEILVFQKRLKQLGYITFKPDGVMGRATVSAIKAFQEDNGLFRDGTIGPATRALLLSGDAQSKVVQLGNSGSDVEAIQKRLIKLNYLSGSATGYYGELTELAVRAFQKRNGLSADGKVGAYTLEILNSSNAKKASATVTPKPSTTSSGSGSSTGGGTTSGGSSTGGGSSSGGSVDVSDKSGVEKLIAIAEGKLGCKYVRGAKGPNTFDCSGFVYWCLRQSGVSISYMTSIAWRSTSRFTEITSMSNLKRGDILVFSGSTMASGHVGIYLGGGKMIDASSGAGQVRQSSSVLKSGGYWENHFLMAYRVF